MDFSHIKTNVISDKFLSANKQKLSEAQAKNEKNNSKIEQDKERLKTACADFESVLLNQMLQTMRKTLSGDALFGKNNGKDIIESMYYEELSTKIARGENNLGIGEALFKQLSSNGDEKP